MSVRPLAALGLLWAAALVAAPEPLGERLGGDTSRPVIAQTAFALPAPNLDARQLRDFAFGNRLFNTNWVQAGSSTTSFDGLGPLFNRVSCSGCHVRDGRGRPPEPGAEMESMLVRISLPGNGPNGGPRPHPAYGDQIQDRAIAGVKVEARVELVWETVQGRYADGEPYELRRPQVQFRDPAYGALGVDLLTSPRVAQIMIGLGLLEAVPDVELLRRADPDDADGDGVSGRANRVWDVRAQRHAIGRFGWKANQPNLRQQVADAAAGDIGITSAHHAADACTSAQTACRESPHGGRPEMSDAFLDKLLLYSRTLAVPTRRDVDDAQVRRGQALFDASGCSACHVRDLRTGTHELAALSQQSIHPFTDLLLHDMGEGLADGRPDFEADGREWRTAPLWGLGLIHNVNGHELLLHDGRARGPAEAILWHGGEAEAARETFRSMDKADRDALLAFLRSL
ncbi:di-heme oxidoredictase family protein [Panacagrimonas sp.]|uniref:di-heme oxidoreductase family protein n=1 Tax=Panacagrimonas sp. TaxID=2480088 RepID=UPI003B52D44E